MDADTILTLPALDVVRYVSTQVTLRAKADPAPDAPALAADSLGTMDVRFSPFNTWYRISSYWEGDFYERTVPGAFKRTFNQHNDPNSAHDMKTLFNHGMDFHIGDKLLGDITSLREETDSPVSTVNLWDTSYNRDLLPGLSRGSYGSSFMFRVSKEEWNNEPGASDHNPEGLPERTVKETSTMEAGPVTFPASPTASAGMRCVSGTDRYYDDLARRDPSRVSRMRDTYDALRSAGRLAPGARLLDPTRLPDVAPLDSPAIVDVRSPRVSAATRQRYLRTKGFSDDTR